MNRSQNNHHISKSSIDNFGDGKLYAEKALRKRRNKVLFRLSVVFLVLFLALILLYFAARTFFKVENFIINGNTQYTDEQIINACGIEQGDFMFTFASSDVERRIAKKCPYVDKVVMRREYPSSLIIEISEISAEYVTYAADKYIVFSKDLKVLEVSDDNRWEESSILFELPPISVAIEGKELIFAQNDKTEYITDFIKALEFYDSEYKIKKAVLTESYSIKFYCGDNHEVRLGKSDELDVKMRTLSKLLKSDKITQTDAARIDVSNPKEPSFVPINVE